jgi:hypothetical protein
MEKYHIKIDYDDKQNRYYIFLDSEDHNVQCFYSCKDAPTVTFTRNLKDVKRVLDSSVYVS